MATARRLASHAAFGVVLVAAAMMARDDGSEPVPSPRPDDVERREPPDPHGFDGNGNGDGVGCES